MVVPLVHTKEKQRLKEKRTKGHRAKQKQKRALQQMRHYITGEWRAFKECERGKVVG
jgi:hypothetical protein